MIPVTHATDTSAVSEGHSGTGTGLRWGYKLSIAGMAAFI